jgi:hypothetical protein
VLWKKPAQRHIATGTKRCQGESCYDGGLASLCKCVFVRLHLCICVRLRLICICM